MTLPSNKGDPEKRVTLPSNKGDSGKRVTLPAELTFVSDVHLYTVRQVF